MGSSAVIGGASPRFVKTGEKMTLSGGRIEVSAAETGAENARVFKSGKNVIKLTNNAYGDMQVVYLVLRP